MSEWKEHKLGKLTTKIGSGATPSGGGNAYKSEGISLIRSQNVLDFKFSYDGLALIDEEQADDLRNVTVQENDILLNITGDSVARTCKVPKEVLPARVNQHVAIVRPDNAKIDSDFLLYYLQSIKDYLLVIAEIGATRNALTKGMIENLDFTIPDLPEQQVVSQTLRSFDNKIDLLHRQNETLGALAEALFRQQFVLNPERKNWREIPLMDVFDFLEGPGIRNWQYTNEGTRFINIRLIEDGEIDTTKASFVSAEEANGKYKHFLLSERDLIISTSGTLGKAAIVRNYHLPLMLNTSVIRFRPKDGINYSYMYEYFKSQDFFEAINSMASGSVQLNFGPTHLKEIVIRFPPESLLSDFRRLVDPLYDKLEKNFLQIRALTLLRDTLLPKLMSGAVRVSS